MANTFITPTRVARMALATLVNSSKMLPLVYRDYDSDFDAAQGDEVTVKIPATFTASKFDQSVGISLQNATQTSTSVKLDTIWDVSIPITSKDLTLEIADFQTEIVQPAMDALVQAVDAQILGLRDDITASITASAYNATTNPNPLFDLIDAGRMLTTAKVLDTGRVAVVDEYIGAQWKRDALANRADARGETGSALRDAAIARQFGFDVYETNAITDFLGVAFHPTAFAFVSRPLVVPPDAPAGQVVSHKGLSVRVIRDYDPTYKQTVLSLDILCGVETLDANRAVIINGLADSV